MPLLPKELELFPLELFSLPPDLHPWGVAHVRSRQEKVLARHLARHGIPFYLPTTASTRTSAGRVLTSHMPLFAGYVFHRAGPESRPLLWRSNVVANLIEVQDQRQLGEELAQLRRLQESGASLKPYLELLAGEPVRIADGVFSGYYGVIVRGKANDRLVVRVSLLDRNVVVELDRGLLRRVR
jgi:transcription antitermination factor NusG